MKKKKRAVKHDGQKPKLSLIPKHALFECGEAFTYGATKYSAYNYKKGIAYSRLVDASMRHLAQFFEGEDLDPESGKSHLAHAMASVAMLIDVVNNHPDCDDRYKDESKSSVSAVRKSRNSRSNKKVSKRKSKRKSR